MRNVVVCITKLPRDRLSHRTPATIRCSKSIMMDSRQVTGHVRDPHSRSVWVVRVDMNGSHRGMPLLPSVASGPRSLHVHFRKPKIQRQKSANFGDAGDSKWGYTVRFVFRVHSTECLHVCNHMPASRRPTFNHGHEGLWLVALVQG